jgi:hypothetical protein
MIALRAGGRLEFQEPRISRMDTDGGGASQLSSRFGEAKTGTLQRRMAAARSQRLGRAMV